MQAQAQELLRFNWVDYFIIGVLVISTLVSLLRGFIKEAVSLATWIAGFWVAFTFTNRLAYALEPHIHSIPLRIAISFGGLFIATLIIGAMFNFLISLLIEKTGLSGTDRVLGVFFGFARGVLFIAVIILIVSTTVYIQEDLWKKSVLIPHFHVVVDWLRSIVPAKFGQLTVMLHQTPPAPPTIAQ